MIMATARCLLLQLVAASASRDWMAPFQRLQVSSPMVVHVVTDTTQPKPELNVAADAMGLGWTVQSQVQPMTFGSTLLLGMDERAVRQNFAWPAGGQVATLTVPKPLSAISVTGGAQVLVDIVTGDLAADGKSNLTVLSFNSSTNASHLFLADDANITVRSGLIGSAFVQAWHGAKVDLRENRSDAIISIKVDSSSSVMVSAAPEPPMQNATLPANGNATNHTADHNASNTTGIAAVIGSENATGNATVNAKKSPEYKITVIP